MLDPNKTNGTSPPQHRNPNLVSGSSPPKKRTLAIPSTPELPRLLTLKSAAAYLSCSLWAARELVWDKALPHIRIGRRVLIERSDLDRFIESRRAA